MKPIKPIETLVETLSIAVKQGLNCVLTPAECLILIKALNSNALSGNPIDLIIERLNQTAHDYINSVTEDLKPRASRSLRKPKR